MKYVGVDLHKQVIVLCVVAVVGGQRQVLTRRRLGCHDTAAVAEFFAALGRFQVAVEATAAYEWFLELIERDAERIVLVHPRKMRIIAESRRKTDRLDAQILAEFLASGELPEAWRPTPRVRQHRALVRQRNAHRRRISGLKCRLRNLLAHYNADRPGLFTQAGRDHVAATSLNASDRFVADQLLAELDFQLSQRSAVDKRLTEFAASAPIAEREARAVLESVPGIGPVTTEIVLSELGDIRRFRAGRRRAVRWSGAGGAGECRRTPRPGNYQGRLAAIALDDDRTRLAAGGQDPPLGFLVRKAEGSLRREEGHCGRGPAGVVRVGIPAEIWTTLPFIE